MSRPKLSLATLGDGPRTIITRDGGLFVVTVEPPQLGFDRPETFATWKAARGFAGGIRLTRSIPIDDRTMEADRG